MSIFRNFGFASALAVALALSACSQAPNQTDAKAPSASPEATPTPDPATYHPPVPTHRYSSKSGYIYYYVEGISENDENNGVGAKQAHGFQYFGKNFVGNYVIAAVNSYGVPMFSAECTKPCEVIRLSNGQAYDFNPDTVIGGAMYDAINGFLNDSRSPDERPNTDTTPAPSPPPSSASSAASDTAAAVEEINAAASGPTNDKISTIFKSLSDRAAPEQRAAFSREQDVWLTQRNACTTRACVDFQERRRLRAVTAEAWAQYNAQNAPLPSP